MTGIKTRITLYKNLNNFQHADKPKKGKKTKGERKKETLTLPDEENIAVDYEDSEDAGTEEVIRLNFIMTDFSFLPLQWPTEVGHCSGIRVTETIICHLPLPTRHCPLATAHSPLPTHHCPLATF